MGGAYLEVHLAHLLVLWKQLWPRKGQWLARVPHSQRLSARPKAPP